MQDTSVGRFREMEANAQRFSDPLHQRILDKIDGELSTENLHSGAWRDWRVTAQVRTESVLAQLLGMREANVLSPEDTESLGKLYPFEICEARARGVYRTEFRFQSETCYV